MKYILATIFCLILSSQTFAQLLNRSFSFGSSYSPSVRLNLPYYNYRVDLKYQAVRNGGLVYTKIPYHYSFPYSSNVENPNNQLSCWTDWEYEKTLLKQKKEKQRGK